MPSTPLHVAVAQPEVILGDLAATVANHARLIEAAEADLIVFPETSLTGYSFEAEPVSPDDLTLVPMVEACSRVGSTALVGAPVKHDWGKAIATLLVDPAGVSIAYLKMCPGADELEHFIAGTEPEVVEVAGWRVGLGICRDTRMPEHLDATAELGMDLYAAGLVHAPGEHAELGRRAEHIADTYRVPVAFAAFAGDAGMIRETSGGSGIWNSDRTLECQSGTTLNSVIYAVLGT